MNPTTEEMQSLKAKLKIIWTAGDYDRFSRLMEGGAREFYERLAVTPGSQLLDVACGSGQLALMAAKDGIEVTGVDLAGNLVERARARAQAEGLRARFEEADAEALPFEDASFDVVVSLIGAMFAPQPNLVAKELLRVCVPGGTIGMANWTPQGFIGQMFKAVSKFIAPSGMPSPVLWGDETTVRERLGHGLSELSLTKRQYLFSYPFPPSEVVEFFRLYYGPTNRAFASLDDKGQTQLRQELEVLWTAHNRAGAGCTTVFAEYLEVMGIRV
ncbi:MAG: ubiquinone biosynthesis methyltransferase UbiE [Nitrospira sp. HN-bin3]|uniref:class I SAM-dependent methyltransferase n=1 Tax=Nitrospira cf. moscoviensis SBR1015 TaxID=96242 RepID=UPI000A097FC5|nr:class I SAM-dependent methyltransferase [Nitrospira cf. moscoviensis SBR1015]OQW49353.1 MAG: ubiquinone biosynthesis methyltransferase UbiE [Nitrospira sp. HN-bin3]